MSKRIKYEQKLKRYKQNLSRTSAGIVMAVCLIPHLLFYFIWDSGQYLIGNYLFSYSISCVILLSITNPIVNEIYYNKVKRILKRIRQSIDK